MQQATVPIRDSTVQYLDEFFDSSHVGSPVITSDKRSSILIEFNMNFIFNKVKVNLLSETGKA